MFARRSIALDNTLRTQDIWNTHPLLIQDGRSDVDVNRMAIRFYLDDYFMGSKCKLASPPVLKAYVKCRDSSDPISRIIFIRNGREAHSASGFEGDMAEASWRDKEWQTGKNYYYVRVEFSSGSVGFSSPVFVNY